MGVVENGRAGGMSAIAFMARLLTAIGRGGAMAPSNGGDVRARVDGGICLVARLILKTRVRLGHSESGATRAVVQRILLGSSRKPRGGTAAPGLTGSSGIDGCRHCAGVGGWVHPDSRQGASHRVDPPPAFERRMQTGNGTEIRGGKVRCSGAGTGMAASPDVRATTRGAGHSEELCEHGSPPTVLPRRRVSGRARLRRALNLSRDHRVCLQ
jgi:hypothetical protein